MGYYGHSVFRGDYRSAHRMQGVRAQGFHPVMLRGDFLGDLGAFAGKLGGYIDKGMQYLPLVGGAVTAYNTAFGKTVTAPGHPALSSPQVGGGGLPALPALPARGGAVQMVKQRGYAGGTPNNTPAQRREDRNDGGTRRRMNVLNVKALRRSLRRADGFLNVAKKFVKVIKPGHHVQLKEHHHKKHKR